MAFLAPSLPFPDWQGTFTEYKYLETISQHEFTPNMSNSYLTNRPEPPFSRLNELKNWLRGFITAPDFFKKEPYHALDDLHSALLAATNEINMRLDPELEATVHCAGESQHRIECDEDAFWAGRILDVDKLCTTGLFGIKTLSRERVIALLTIARDEVQWMSNEIRRLETHCKIARELKGCKNRESFTYYPSPRNAVPDELNSLKGASILVGVDGEGVDDDNTLEDGQIEHEAMLEAERDKENERRDSKDMVPSMRKANLDSMGF